MTEDEKDFWEWSKNVHIRSKQWPWHEIEFTQERDRIAFCEGREKQNHPTIAEAQADSQSEAGERWAKMERKEKEETDGRGNLRTR